MIRATSSSEAVVTDNGELRRTLGAMDLTLIAIGAVIGSGIFLGPGTVIRQSGGWLELLRRFDRLAPAGKEPKTIDMIFS